MSDERPNTERGSASASTILVVDDDTTFRRSVSRILTAEGYSCVEAVNAAQARVAMTVEADVTAVLCDVQMPGQSGIDLLRHLVADFPDVAVVMTTGVDDPRIAAKATDIGAYGYLRKPFYRDELLAALASALRRRDLAVHTRLA